MSFAKRESIVREIWNRLRSATGVVTSKRNPETPPRPEDLPALNLFEMEETHEQSQGRDYPRYKNDFSIAIEAIVKGNSEESSYGELATLVDNMVKSLFSAPRLLGGRVELEKIRTTRPVSAPIGEHVKGIGFIYKVRYSSDIADLFV